MPMGPGKYDHLATIAREQAHAECVVLIVINGNAGSGFSVQALTHGMIAKLPRLLRALADSVERGI